MYIIGPQYFFEKEDNNGKTQLFKMRGNALKGSRQPNDIKPTLRHFLEFKSLI
jgi:hypothetical protein